MVLLYISASPLWVWLSFMLIFPIAFLLMANVVRQTYLKINPAKGHRLARRIIYFYLLFFILVAALAVSGVFAVNTLPPRIFLITTVPLMAFYFIYVWSAKWFREFLAYSSLSSLVFLHVFRFVGVYFLIAYAYGQLPAHFALLGGWGDIISALMAVWVVWELKRKSAYAIRLTYIWNIIGLLDILDVIFVAIITTKEAIIKNEIGVLEFASFPFCWIPAFAPATIIFLHLVVFRKLKMLRIEGDQKS